MDSSISVFAQAGLLADWQIAELVHNNLMIDPFFNCQIRSFYIPPTDKEVKIVSYGLSSYGYDARLSNKFKIPNPDYVAKHKDYYPGNQGESLVYDLEKPPKDAFIDVVGNSFVIQPGHMILGKTVEYFRIPNNVEVICVGKSTYARVGILVNLTPLEAGWEGNVTLEISNVSPFNVRVFANQGIAQFMFYQGSAPCITTYADKKGKYQGHTEVTEAKL